MVRSIASCTEVQVTMPACRAAASYTAAEPAMAPVCEAAALPTLLGEPAAQRHERL